MQVQILLHRAVPLANKINTGLTQLTYTPRPADVPLKRDDWPTLGSMIASGRRLVVFLDAGADPTQVASILPEFAMVCTPSTRTAAGALLNLVKP